MLHRPHLVLDGLRLMAAASPAREPGVRLRLRRRGARRRCSRALDETAGPVGVPGRGRPRSRTPTSPARRARWSAPSTAAPRCRRRSRRARSRRASAGRRPWCRTSRRWPTSPCSPRDRCAPATRSSRRSTGGEHRTRRSSRCRSASPRSASSCPPACAASLAGGLFGGLLADPWHLPLDHEAFRAAGSGLGCGSFVLLGADDCPVDAAADAVALSRRRERPAVRRLHQRDRRDARRTRRSAARRRPTCRRRRPDGGLDAEGPRPRRLRAGRRRRPDGRVAAARVPRRGAPPTSRHPCPRCAALGAAAPSHPQPSWRSHEARPRLRPPARATASASRPHPTSSTSTTGATPAWSATAAVPGGPRRPRARAVEVCPARRCGCSGDAGRT